MPPCLIRIASFALAVPLALIATLAGADPAQALLSQINDYRAQARLCDGRQFAPAGPLAPSAALGRVRLRAGKTLDQALQEVGYLAADSEAVQLIGPRNRRAAFKSLKEQQCRLLLDGAFAEAGITQEGQRWQLVLARPLLADDLGDWESAGRAVLEAVNAARAEARVCGARRRDAVAPLVWSPALAEVARGHSQDMAQQGYVAHQARDGGSVGDRATQAGFDWGQVGENLAAGQGSVEQVVAGWLSSPAHCANLMNPAFTHMGAAYALEAASPARIYWTQVFASASRR